MQFEGEREWIEEQRGDLGLYEARRQARACFLEVAINQAKTVEDLKPVLLRLLSGE